MLPKALKSRPKSNKSPNLVTLLLMPMRYFLPVYTLGQSALGRRRRKQIKREELPGNYPIIKSSNYLKFLKKMVRTAPASFFDFLLFYLKTFQRERERERETDDILKRERLISNSLNIKSPNYMMFLKRIGPTPASFCCFFILFKKIFTEQYWWPNSAGFKFESSEYKAHYTLNCHGYVLPTPRATFLALLNCN